MPLALELAVTWTRSLTVPELLTELRADLDVLAADLRDLPERQRSIRTVLAYSWSLLGDAEREAMAYLSVFRGGFTHEAAEKVAGVHLALLFGLIARSLLSRSDDGRFQVHELVRRYAAERATGADELRTAHARYYLAAPAERTAALNSATRAEAFEELLAEFDNIRAALGLGVERVGDEALRGALTSALPAMFTLFLEAGALSEFAAVLERLKAEVAARDPATAELALVVGQQLGRAAMSRGDFSAARGLLEPLIPRLRELDAGGVPDGVASLARVFDWLGSCARIAGDLEGAEEYVGEALALAERQGSRKRPSTNAGTQADDPGLLADVTYNLASLREVQGRGAEAMTWYEQSLSSSLSIGDDRRAATRRLSLARRLIIASGDPGSDADSDSTSGLEAAKRHLEEALETGRVTRSARLAGAALNALGVLAGRQQDPAAAEHYQLEALALARSQGQHDDQRVALANLGGLLNDHGRLDEAAVYLRQALEHALDSNNPSGLNQTYSPLGANCSVRGDHDGAAGYFIAALAPEVVRGIAPVAVTQCLSLLANAHEAAGRSASARELRAYLLEEPATPASLKAKIGAALAKESGAPAGGQGSAEARPALLDVAAAQREDLLASA